MALILIIEDEADIREVVEYNLRQAGHETVGTARGRDGLRLANDRLPDLVILDLMLPDLSGTEVAKSLKREPPTRAIPVIMLTAKGEEVDRIVGFELGADDYVTKPFSVRELLLRVQAVLRRAQGPADETPLVRFGRLEIDRDAHRVRVDQRPIELTALELRLLLFLHDRKNRVQSRETLLDEVWGVSSDITTRTVDTHVKRLREKLGPAAAYIETVRGAGYRFAGSPEEIAT